MHSDTPRITDGEVSGRPFTGGARALAALALFSAGGIHGAQALHHLLDGSFGVGVHAAFFTAAALFQVVAGVVVVVRSHRRAARIVAVANLGLGGVWVATVTTGLPSSLTGAQEPVTLAGGLATALVALAAFVLLAGPGAAKGVRTTPGWGEMRAAPFLGAAAVALFGSASLIPVPAGAHGHHTAAGAHHGGAHAGAPHVKGVHLHGLGGDDFDPGPDPARQARGVLTGTSVGGGLRPGAVAVDDAVLWVADRGAGLVHRLDATSGRALGTPTRVGVHPSGIAVGAGSVWVANAGSDTVSRLDRATGENLATISVGSVPVGVAVGAGYVWVTNSAEGTVSRIDPAGEDVFTTARIGYGPTAITFAEDRPWVVNSLDRAVVSLDPATTAVVTETPVDGGPSSIQFGHGSLWVASSSAGTVTRIHPVSGQRVGVPIKVDRRSQPGQGPAALAIGNQIWVLNNHDKTVLGIDPATHAVSPPRFIDRHVARHIAPASLAVTNAGQLWATDQDSGRLVRIQTRKDTR